MSSALCGNSRTCGTSWLPLPSVLLLTAVMMVDAQSCDPVHGGLGQCTSLLNCPDLQQWLQPQDVGLFIQEHGCGREQSNGDVLVCCPHYTAVAQDPPTTSGTSGGSSSCGSEKINQGADWPFVVGLGSSTPSTYTVRCNGALVTSQWVLTDARCFVKFNIIEAFFGLGFADWRNKTTVPVTVKLWPRNYDGFNDFNGIGLAKLAQPVQLSDSIQLACLPPPPGSAPTPPPGTANFAVFVGQVINEDGRAALDVMSELVRPVPLQQCRAADVVVVPTGSHLCTDGVRHCKLETRPLLVRQEAGAYTLLGVGGIQKHICSPSTSTFTEVSKYLEWINSYTAPSEPEELLVDSATDLLHHLNNLPNFPACGRRRKAGSEWPFLAALGNYDSTVGGFGGDFTSQCTAVILTPEWLLSDARCVNSNPVLLAAVGISGGFSTTAYHVVESKHFPPDYSADVEHSSVALVKIRGPPPPAFSENVQPVCRQGAWHDDAVTLHAVSAGYTFGSSEGLRLSSHTKIVRRDTAGSCAASRFIDFQTPADGFICATSSNFACNFVANPPVLLEQHPISGSFTVVGVGGDNSNHCRGDFMGYVRVKPHLPWIKSVVFPDGDPDDVGLSKILG